MNTESNNGWKILISLAVAALIASAVLFLKSDTSVTPVQDVQQLVKQSEQPTATISSVDDVEAALLSSVASEVTLLEGLDSSASVSADSATLESLGKTYDETTL